MKEATFHVSGLHCPSCEILIEKKLISKKNIRSIEVSLRDSSLLIEHTGKAPTVHELNAMFREDGYTFKKKSSGGAGTAPRTGATISITRNALIDGLWVLGVSIAAVILLWVINRSGISSLVRVTETSSLPTFFFFGLLAGFSSCAALVGGLILSMSKQWSEVYNEGEKSAIPHISFNAGRLLSYAILGVVLGAVGSFLVVSPVVYAVITVGVAVLMILLALQMLGVRGLEKFQVTMPRALTRYVADESNFSGRFMPFALGALTFFLPCGFTITAQGMALASGSPIQGGLIMLAFALGTLPVLLFIGLSSNALLSKPDVSGRFLKIAGVVVLIFAFYNINAQLNVLGIKSLDDVAIGAEENAGKELPPLVDGKQVVEMTASASRYSPDYFRVLAGVPVRWEITNAGVSGCTNAIISQGLFEGQVSVDDDVVVKEFTPEEPGVYKFSCWMGMVTGVFEVVDSKNAGGSEPGAIDRDAQIESAGVSEDSSGGCDGSCGGGCGGSCGSPACAVAQ